MFRARKTAIEAGKELERVLSKMIKQLCECCNEWIDQRELVWDLEEDRLVCNECYSGKDEN